MWRDPFRYSAIKPRCTFRPFDRKHVRHTRHMLSVSYINVTYVRRFSRVTAGKLTRNTVIVGFPFSPWQRACWSSNGVDEARSIVVQEHVFCIYRIYPWPIALPIKRRHSGGPSFAVGIFSTRRESEKRHFYVDPGTQIPEIPLVWNAPLMRTIFNLFNRMGRGI